MQTFSWGTTPQGTINAALPEKYHMELNRNDMLAVLEALLERSVPALDETAERCASLRSSILETIDIEEI